MSLWDFVGSINETKKDLIAEDPQNEKDYVPFMINRALSYFPDTIMYANEMNQHASLAKKMQYDFYLYAIPKKRRFSKWSKADKPSDDIKLIMTHYQYNRAKALEVLDLLTEDQLKDLKEKYKTGGR